MIPYGRQNISQEDIDQVISTLKSDYITQGPKIGEFERLITTFVGAKYGVAVNSATSALHLACLALNVGPGDLIWTVPNTFVASANCARYCGADVDFVDIDPKTLNMSAVELKEKLATAAKQGRLPKVIIPVHFSGRSCPMKEISDITRSYGVKIIEDASHAIGAEYLGKKVGACEFSDMVVFSFHPVKIITTAEGGFITTNDEKINEAVSRLRTHGITRDSGLLENKNEGPWYYEQHGLGYNYRITDIQAALGVSQMTRINSFIVERNKRALIYNEALSQLPLILPGIPGDGISAWHLYVIQLKDPGKRRFVFEFMREKGIGVNVHYIPVHTQPYYKELGFKAGDFPCSETYYNSAISLPMFPDLSIDDQEHVINVLRDALIKAGLTR